jgi:hypothetical protein
MWKENLYQSSNLLVAPLTSHMTQMHRSSWPVIARTIGSDARLSMVVASDRGPGGGACGGGMCVRLQQDATTAGAILL